MQLTLSDSDHAFQADVRAFLAQALTPDLRRAASLQTGVFAEADVSRRWHKILFEKGWIAPAWPKDYGGTGWSTVRKYIFESECADADAPVLPNGGLQMCGPVLMHYGTPEQKAFFLPRILNGEHYWCQGYSEPQAGSDLAALQCRAERDGEDYVLNGTKIWTTHAHNANWIFMLVRTARTGKPQAGITFLLAPMSSPGITVRPILSLSGEHEVNQVFFDNVRVPLKYRVGEENDGWTVAKYLLEFERGHAFAPRMKSWLREVREIALAEPDGYGGRLWDDPNFRNKVAVTEVEVMAVDLTERRLIAQLSAGRSIGDTAASMLKLKGTETGQLVTELAVEALGHYAAADQRRGLSSHNDNDIVGPDYAARPVARYLNMRAASIYGGANEVQRNILARVMLGL